MQPYKEESLMISEEQIDFIKHSLPFWPHLTQQEQEELCNHTTCVSFLRGHTIHQTQDGCNGLLLICQGQLRTYMLSENGKEITLYRLYAKDVCILSAACVLDTITFDVAIDAEQDTQVLQINASFFHGLADHNIYVKCFGYELATMRFSDVMWAMQQILFMSADQRLAIFLVDELAKEGKDELHLTHEQIARYMGSAREVVTRLLRYFSQEGIVQLSRGGLKVLNREKLRALANGT